MKLLRSAVVLAALFIGSQAHATVTSVAFKGALDNVSSGLNGKYTAGQTFTGQFTYDDIKGPSGSIWIGGNTISFTAGDTFVNDSNGSATLSHHAVPWLGGTVSDSWGSGIDGVHFSLLFVPGLGQGVYAKPADILKLPFDSSGLFNLDYDGEGSASGHLNELAVIDPAAVPEPASALLVALGLGGIFAGRRARRQQAPAQA